jgi:hypothetical protein
MKSQLINLTFLGVIMFVCACSGKKEVHSHDETVEQKEWKEMDVFHTVMAETFHPFKDSADLDPIKKQASELAAAADTWVNAPLPEKVNNEEVKNKLQQLKSETQALLDFVNANDDHAIGNQLTKVHDLFHEIQESWYVGEGHSDDHHNHSHDH